MFHRSNATYKFDSGLVPPILADEANPLNRIAALIPEKAKVLDIGAGNGLLAHILRQVRQDVVVDGIEPSEFAAEIARKYYRNFYTGYAQDYKQQILAENYDLIVLADVIEHMQDPLAFLEELFRDLPEPARVVISTPNVAFGAVRIALLNGRFNYVDSGILEKTHLRFFTMQTLLQMVEALGANVEKLFLLKRNMFASEIDIRTCRVGLSDIMRISDDELASTYQFLCVLTKAQVVQERASYGKAARLAVLQYLLLRLSNIRVLRGLPRLSSWIQRKL